LDIRFDPARIPYISGDPSSKPFGRFPFLKVAALDLQLFLFFHIIDIHQVEEN